MIEKKNKTSDAQIRASRNYDERNGKVVIGCKVTREYKSIVEEYAKNKGFKSVNAYLLDLIDRDMNV